jgi:hypothetical protein
MPFRDINSPPYQPFYDVIASGALAPRSNLTTVIGKFAAKKFWEIASSGESPLSQ